MMIEKNKIIQIQHGYYKTLILTNHKKNEVYVQTDGSKNFSICVDFESAIIESIHDLQLRSEILREVEIENMSHIKNVIKIIHEIIKNDINDVYDENIIIISYDHNDQEGLKNIQIKSEKSKIRLFVPIINKCIAYDITILNDNPQTFFKTKTYIIDKITSSTILKIKEIVKATNENFKIFSDESKKLLYKLIDEYIVGDIESGIVGIFSYSKILIPHWGSIIVKFIDTKEKRISVYEIPPSDKEDYTDE